jgi:hypothetical protein
MFITLQYKTYIMSYENFYYASLTYWELEQAINNPNILGGYKKRCQQELDKRLSEQTEILEL